MQALVGQEEIYSLSRENFDIAQAVVNAFGDCRFASVDMLESGKVLEINAFPGGNGLHALYGISVGKLIMDRMEQLAYDAREAIGGQYKVG